MRGRRRGWVCREDVRPLPLISTSTSASFDSGIGERYSFFDVRSSASLVAPRCSHVAGSSLSAPNDGAIDIVQPRSHSAVVDTSLDLQCKVSPTSGLNV